MNFVKLLAYFSLITKPKKQIQKQIQLQQQYSNCYMKSSYLSVDYRKDINLEKWSK